MTHEELLEHDEVYRLRNQQIEAVKEVERMRD